MTRRPRWIHLDEDRRTTVRLAWTWDAPSDARAHMIDDLQSRGVSEGVVEDAEVVLAELVANAVEHGRPDEHDEVEVSWFLHDDRLLISVHDSGHVSADLLRAADFTDDAVRGRGLAIVEHLSDRWTAETDDGVRVTAELRFAPEAGQGASAGSDPNRSVTADS